MSDTNYYDVVGPLELNSQNIDEDFTNVLPVLDLELPDLLITEDDDDDEEDTIDFSANEDIWTDIGLDPALIDSSQSGNLSSSSFPSSSSSSIPPPVNIMMNSEVLPRSAFPSNNNS